MDIKNLPVLDPAQIRVLGSLMEKCKTTPDYYPMTINGLTSACNQKTSRKPVVQYDESIIITALNLTGPLFKGAVQYEFWQTI